MKLPQTPELLVARRIVSACLPALVAVVAVLALATLAQACPNCASGEPERAGGDIVSGYFWSILFMLAMPFTILGSFSGYMYYLVRKDRAAKAAARKVVAPTDTSETNASRHRQHEPVGVD